MSTVKETKELLTFVCSLGNGIGLALEDKQITWSDASYLMMSVQTAPAAFSDVAKIKDELAEFTAEEQTELKDHVMSRFDIPQDEIEKYIEDGINLALQLYAYVSLFLNRNKQPTA